MREVICDRCGKRYQIDEGKLTQQTTKATCTECGHGFIVEKETKKIGIPKGPGSEDMAASKNIQWRNRVQVRVSAILIFLTTIILIGYAVVNYQLEKTKMNNEIKLLTKITATRLSKQLIEPFWALDNDLLQDSIKYEMMNKQVYAILIRDRSGKDIYLGRKRNSSWKIEKATMDIKDNDLISKSIDIKRGEDTIGALEVYLTPRFMQETLQRATIYMIFTVLILDFILFISIYSILSRAIIRPIMNLTDAAERISMGDLNAKLHVRTNDEIGMLIKAFQRMQNSLNFAMKRLGS